MKTFSPRTLAAAGLAVSLLGAAAVQAALPNTVTFRNFFGSMTFTRPVTFVPYPAEDSAYIVLQQSGKIMTVRRQAGAWARTDSASIAVLNGTSSGNEQGLLGFAFHPQYRQNRKYYVYYIATGATNGFDLIAERTADSTLRPHSTDAQRTLLRLTDPYNNHNGGTLAFGADGYLYFALGDGGNGGDPAGRAQNPDSLFGKFMRLDVNGADAFPADTTRNYAIPADNPFVGQAGKKPEVWALGVRNPFKWSFHPVTGEIWVGDVGQDYAEEVSHVTKGANMGWDTREGNTCFNSAAVTSPLSSCVTAGMTPAVISILQPKAQSITGGVFFIGNPASAYHGVYFYGDYATDSVWAARIVNDSVTEQIKIGTINTVASFNLDLQGRVFALNIDNGVVNILESPDMQPAVTGVRPVLRAGMKAFSLADYRRNPGEYEVRALDGRALRGSFKGAALIRKTDSQQPAQLVPFVW